MQPIYKHHVARTRRRKLQTRVWEELGRAVNGLPRAGLNDMEHVTHM